MSTPRKNTSTRRERAIIAATLATLAAGIAAPPLLTRDTSPPAREWTILPAAVRTPDPWAGYDCVSLPDGWQQCSQHGYRGRP
jgi:hypothetical protein